jgi:hypothetical protein
MGDLKESNYAMRNGPLRLNAESVKAVAGKPDNGKHSFWGRADQRESRQSICNKCIAMPF